MGKAGVEQVISIANKGYHHPAWSSRAGQNNQEMGAHQTEGMNEPEEEGRGGVLSQTNHPLAPPEARGDGNCPPGAGGEIHPQMSCS